MTTVMFQDGQGKKAGSGRSYQDRRGDGQDRQQNRSDNRDRDGQGKREVRNAAVLIRIAVGMVKDRQQNRSDNRDRDGQGKKKIRRVTVSQDNQDSDARSICGENDRKPSKEGRESVTRITKR